MIRLILARLGLRIEYVSEYGVHSRRYSGIDFQCARPIHEHMSVAPPWARRRIVPASATPPHPGTIYPS